MTLVLAYYVGGMRTMTKKLLVACEYSGVVREAFAKKGWDAWSCDLLPTDQPSDKHIQGDALEAIASQKWDMIIAHPPCTFICHAPQEMGMSTPQVLKVTMTPPTNGMGG